MSAISTASVSTPALVYVRGPRGPWPQIWREPISDIDGYWQGRIVAVHPLDEAWLGLAIVSLQKIYPAPAPWPGEPKVKL